MAKKSAGKGTSFGRNSKTAPSTGGSIGTYKVKNNMPGKQGGKAKLGNPSSSMVSLSKIGNKGK